MRSRGWLAALALVALALPASADVVGSRVETLEIEDLAQTEATGWEDFTGRAVLIELFAYW